jgi:hypothetical protein
VVKAGLVAFAALSAEIFVPPVAVVIETAACAELAENKKESANSKPTIFFI